MDVWGRAPFDVSLAIKWLWRTGYAPIRRVPDWRLPSCGGDRGRTGCGGPAMSGRRTPPKSRNPRLIVPVLAAAVLGVAPSCFAAPGQGAVPEWFRAEDPRGAAPARPSGPT